MRIDLFCNDGSPLGIIPPDIYTRGVGGAELSMMTWAETMAGRGHAVRVFNNPPMAGEFDRVEYQPQSAFIPHETRDVFVVYRSPNKHVRHAKAGMKIHWSTDQYTIGDFGRDIFPFVDKVVCISPYHVNYHKNRYGIEDRKIGYFDLGVRMQDYEGQRVDKIPGRCIFCSVPDRGLDLMQILWPRIKEHVPDASLVITSDYTLWGSNNPGNHQYRLDFLNLPDVIFLGKIGREQLAREQLAAVCQSYCSTYEELFCISSAECQVAGAVPVTSSLGALPTTNNGYTIVGNPMEVGWQDAFVERVVKVLKSNEDPGDMIKKARQRFDWNRICEQWEHLIETGEFDNRRSA